MKQKMNLLFYASLSMMLCTSIVGCSNDDDYNNENEFVTLAEQKMTRSLNEGGIIYPSAAEILSNNNVKTKMDQLWRQTIANASQSGRREYGCYIYHNHTNDTYHFVDVCGPVQTEPSSAGIVFNVSLTSELCAVFHTHTTLQYYDTTYNRVVGPSTSDTNSTLASLMPCFVYDYVKGIRGGDSKDDPAMIYTYGLNKRYQ